MTLTYAQPTEFIPLLPEVEVPITREEALYLGSLADAGIIRNLRSIERTATKLRANPKMKPRPLNLTERQAAIVERELRFYRERLRDS